MQSSLCFISCENFRREIAAAVESEHLADVTLGTFPARCGSPPLDWSTVRDAMPAQAGKHTQAWVFGGCCVAKLRGSSEGLSSCRIYPAAQCCALVADQGIVDHYQGQGAYILTPGWLANWRSRIEEWGFTQETAQAFFGESVSRLLLLDTGVDPKSVEHLREFAGFVGLPYDRVMVGLGHLRQLLVQLTLEWRLAQETEARARATADLQRQLADHATVADFCGRLAGVSSEAEVIERAMELLVMLSAPGRLVFLPMREGIPGNPVSRPGRLRDPEATSDRLAAFQGTYTWTPSGSGFVLRLSSDDETLGVLEVEDVAFPEHRQHYLNVALTMAGPLALAITNARYHERLQEANEELEAANEELQAQSEELQAQQAALQDLSEELAAARARLEAVIQQMPAGVFIAEVPSGRILLGNAELERLFQRPIPSSFTIHEYERWERFYPDGRPYQPGEIPAIRSLQTGEVVTGEEIEILRADGTRRSVSVNAAPIRDGQGRVVAVVAVNLDTTDRRRAEAGLRFVSEASEVLSSSLDYETTLARIAHLALPALADYCVIDLVQESGEVRRVAAAHADPSRQKLVDELRRYPPDPRMPEGVPDVLRTGTPLLLPEVPECRLRAAAQDEGHLRILRELGMSSVIIVPLRARGRIIGALTFASADRVRRYDPEDLSLAEEIAGRAAVAVDNARLYCEAQEANAAKDQFLAVLSHELRNPLSPILAGAELLRRTFTGEARVQRTLEIIERNARLQARLVDDLLDLSRITRGKVQLQRAPVTLDGVVNAAVQAKRGEIENGGLSLDASIEAGLWVLGDSDRLQQVILNLLGNAAKFTPPGGTVRVRVQKGDGVGQIVVEDTGIGIDRTLLAHLFDMFRQGEIAGQRQQGLGIGLSLVRSLAEMHGGRVWAESEGAGKGSRFTVELPLVSAPSILASAGQDGRSFRRLRILLVEDNPDTRALLQENLESMGYSVRSVADGEDALAQLRQEKPDVILSDIGLPGMSGYEFLREARQSFGAKDVAAFAITGFGRDEDVSRAQEAGFVGHFVKPVDIGALDLRLREWLSAGVEPPIS